MWKNEEEGLLIEPQYLIQLFVTVVFSKIIYMAWGRGSKFPKNYVLVGLCTAPKVKWSIKDCHIFNREKSVSGCLVVGDQATECYID